MRSATLLSTSLALGVFSRLVHRQDDNVCTLQPESLDEDVDDVPSILEAFDSCGHDGTVIFSNGTFHINSVMNTTNLVNCDVSLRGELRWSTDIDYWKNNVFDVIFQNQSTGWLFGGTNVTLRGEGGWYNGNGQAWYTQNRNESNQPGRPISITVFNSTNVLLDNLSIVQPQFWATHVWESKNVSITNFYSNATTNDEWNVVNTDGFDSWNADMIRIENASITTMDDCLAPKGNTTNMYVRNVTCHWSNGMTIGSVGQYPDTPDYVQNVTMEDVRCLNSRNGAYIKTWQGEPDDPDSEIPRGGGAGLIRNITFRNFEMENVEFPIYISQCIYTRNDGEYCNSSRIQIEDVTWADIHGTSTWNLASSLYCSGLNPCDNIYFENVNIDSVNSTQGLPNYNTTIQHQVHQCANIINQNGSGIPCNREAPNNFPQHPSGNIREESGRGQAFQESSTAASAAPGWGWLF